ncbi:MAG TPA: hypothetical protein VFU49_10335 [Ktedonobacteraceae bacterium]|nr:hypothetical protein [Ktedonobacteraceae bacterium]
MSLIYCPSCDKLLPDTAKRCTTCGRLVVASASQSPLPPNAEWHTFTDMEHSQETDTCEARKTNLLPDSYQQVTWHKEVEYSSKREPASHSPRPPQTPLRTPQPPYSYPRPRRLTPAVFFWLCFALFLVLILGGISGIVTSLGRGLINSGHNGGITLQVTPNAINVGGTITLRGAHFSPRGRIGLTRDSSIPLMDTGGNGIITADTSGNFTDTAIVDGDWGSGPHTLNAEDAITHKIATFPILVIGQNTSLRPAHLRLSVNTLDLGSGDQATNGSKTIILSNLGGGQINWQGLPNRSWLQISPESGTITGGQTAKVTVAVDRSNMQPGSYDAQLLFKSNVGDIPLPITMQVTPLLPGHEPVLQLSPAVLSFTGIDGGASPPVQAITISNPGILSLPWTATTDQQWLNVTPRSNIVNPSGSETAIVSVNTSTLLPGTYHGVITFSGTGSNAVQDSPQSVNVSVTIIPGCTLQISPNLLAFTGSYLQAAPPPRTISLGTSQSCTAPLQWSASSNASWLNISATHGATPAKPTVSVNTSGLLPGAYNSAINFSTSAGTQSLAVSLAIGQPTSPIISVPSNPLTFNGVIGQGVQPATQTVSLANTGGGTLKWSATETTTTGGEWLDVTPGDGTLSANQGVNLSVVPTLSGGMIPGTYTGSITITGTDAAGKSATGSPQVIPVSLVVQAACATTVDTNALTFTGESSQSLAQQIITIKAGGACTNALHWTAATATTPAGGAWLSLAQTAGTVTLTDPSTLSVSVITNDLAAGTYNGTITITTKDSVSHAQIGSPLHITVTLVIKPPCTLQAPSVSTVNAAAEAGTNPPSSTFTINVTGTCEGNVTITPNITLGAGSGWLAVSPPSATVAAGDSQTFTIDITSASLAVGSYSGTISLGAINGGTAIAGSPQTVGVSLTVMQPPALTLSPASLTINATTGTVSQPFTVGNSGGTPLNWTAALNTGAPTFVSLSVGTGSNLAGGDSSTVNLIVDATSAAGGNTYQANVTISAIDPATGQAANGSPITLPVTINIAAPAMQVSATQLTYNATMGGGNPSPQAITITNIGGRALSWTAGAPSRNWLSVSPLSDSDASMATSTVTFSVTIRSMGEGAYTATVAITPSVGIPVTITVSLTITGPGPPTPILRTTPIPTSTALSVTPIPAIKLESGVVRPR